MVQNEKIRGEISAAGLKYWEVAYQVGVCEATLCVWLRKPLSKERTERIETAIASLCAQRGQGATV